MDERVETYEEETGELTFRAIGRFIKRSYLRTLIYIAAAVVLATLVVLPLKMFWRLDPTVSARLEFVYEGVNQGLDPHGATFDKDTVRSASVVSSAISQADLSAKLTDVDAVRNAISIDDVYSEEYLDLRALADKGDADAIRRLASYEFYPTKYDVTLGNLKALGLDKQEGTALVECVINAYKQWFAARYTQKNVYSASSFTQAGSSDNMDYLNYYDLYMGQLRSMHDYIVQMSERDASFRSSVTNKTFADLNQMYQALESAYTTFNSFIVSNSVSKDLTVTKNNIETTVRQYTNRQESLNNTITKIQDQIAAYKPNTSTDSNNGGTTTVVTYPPEYHKLQQQLTAYILEQAEVTASLSEYTSRQEMFKNVEELPDSKLITDADNMLARLRADSVALVTAVNDTVTDYFDSRLLTNSVRVVQPAVYTRTAVSIPTLYIYVAAVFVGLVVGLIVSQVLYKRALKSKDQPAVEPEEQPQASENKA